MQVALRGPEYHELCAAPERSGPAGKRFLLAGVTLVSASAIAVTPVASTLPEISIQKRAVELSAWVSPSETWQTTISTALGHVQYGLNAIGTETVPALQRILTEGPKALGELFTGLSNKEAWAQLNADLPGYGEIIKTGLAGTKAGFEKQMADLPTYLTAAGAALKEGKFTEALQQMNWWFLFTVGEIGWPMFASFEIPGEIARTFGATKLANVLDGLLTNNAAGNYAMAILGPVVTAAFQFTEVLDSIVTNVKAKDWETAISDLVNLPAKVTNAFLNGYTPSFAAAPWPGLLTKDGLLESILFKIPNAIGWALTQGSQTSEIAPASTPDALSKVSSTEVSSTANLLTLKVASTTDSTKGAAAAAADTTEAGTTETTESGTAETTADAGTTEPTSGTTAPTGTESGTTGTESGTTADAAAPGAGTTDAETDAETDAAKDDAGKPDTAKSDRAKSRIGKTDGAKSRDKVAGAPADGAAGTTAGSTGTDAGKARGSKAGKAKAASASAGTDKADNAKSDGGASGGGE